MNQTGATSASTHGYRALTISQPYASLIADGIKWVENRQWATSYRGPLAIHAGKGTQYLTRRQLLDYPTGAVIAIADVVACIPLNTVRKRGRSGVLEHLGIAFDVFIQHEHTEGPWCWILRDVRKFREPMPCRGAQGLWKWAGPTCVDLSMYDPPIDNVDPKTEADECLKIALNDMASASAGHPPTLPHIRNVAGHSLERIRELEKVADEIDSHLADEVIEARERIVELENKLIEMGTYVRTQEQSWQDGHAVQEQRHQAEIDRLVRVVAVRCNFATPCGNCEACQRASDVMSDLA